MVEEHLMETQSSVWEGVITLVLGILCIWIFSYIRSKK